MREEDDNSNPILARIRQELGKLPLSDDEITQVVPQLAATCQLMKLTDLDSQFFDFHRKVNAVVERFAADGLTTGDYLKAALTRPSLFSQSPATIAGNITGVVERFATDGLTTGDYLKAALKQPQLFYQSPATIAANITGFVERFAADGLTTGDYLKAALTRPSLFTVSPPTVAGNIAGVVERFAADGLTIGDYLKAALKQPQLFYQSPATLAGNITGVVERFAAKGLTTGDYLKAALKQPQLFYQAPATVIGHVNLLIDLHRQGLVTFPGEANAPPGQPLVPLFAFLLKNPAYFSLADDNFTLREISARVTGERPTRAALIRRSRYQVESELAETLGQPDADAPVPKVPRPSNGSDPEPHARNLLLRALIRGGLVKGTLQR